MTRRLRKPYRPDRPKYATIEPDGTVRPLTLEEAAALLQGPVTTEGPAAETTPRTPGWYERIDP